MKQFAAIIFDMDGVLVNSEPLHDKAWETLFAELDIAHNHGVVFADYVGRSDRVLLRDLIARHGLPHTADELIQRKLRHLLALLRQHRVEFRELRDLLPALAARYRLAVATSAPHVAIDVVMEVTGFRPHFQALVSRDDVRAGKPDPGVYLLAAQRLGVATSDCCAIEDSPAGIEAAKAAGMTCVALATSLPAARLAGADQIGRDHAALRQLLLP
jgi:HAD superfamily hydrolase (TIGR01509 family)